MTLDLGVSELLMGALVTLNAALQVLVMPLFERVTDCFDRKLPLVAGMIVAGLASLVFSAANVPDALWVRIAVTVGGFLLVGASYPSVVTAATAFIGDVAPERRRSELLGLQSTAQGVGGIVGPPLVGLLATMASYGVSFAAFSGLCFLGATLVLGGLVESHPTLRTASTGTSE